MKREWQTIESAPKDGTRFLTYQADSGRGNDYYAVARWAMNEWEAYEEIDGTNTFRRVKKSKVSLYPDHEWFRPTHWMLLPDPPTTDKSLTDPDDMGIPTSWPAGGER